jgi:transcriptional regulator with XRE-family HTH domain
MSLRVDRLQNLREQKGWSRRELAVRCGIGANMVYKYEALQTEPTTSSLKKLAEMLDVSSDYLLGLSDNPHGQYGHGTLTVEDEAILQTFHREGWAGLLHMGTDYLAGRKSE